LTASSRLFSQAATSPRRRLLTWLLVATLTSLTLAGLTASPLTTRLDNILYDALQRASSRPVDPSILIVEVDEKSLRDMGAWPWSRTAHARMIDHLTQAGARTIVYDVLFSQPAATPSDDVALANAIALSMLAQPYEAVLAHNAAHIRRNHNEIFVIFLTQIAQ